MCFWLVGWSYDMYYHLKNELRVIFPYCIESKFRTIFGLIRVFVCCIVLVLNGTMCNAHTENCEHLALNEWCGTWRLKMKSLIMILLAVFNTWSFLQYGVGRRVNHFFLFSGLFSKCRNSLKHPSFLLKLIFLILLCSIPMANQNSERCMERRNWFTIVFLFSLVLLRN